MPVHIFPLGEKEPRLGQGVLVCPGAAVVGAVDLGDRVSVWYNAVIRGDLAPIRVGRETNIQDGAILHVDTDQPLEVGARVTVGHGAILHGCTVGDGSLIGMGAMILSGARVGEEAFIAAGALVPEGKEIPARALAVGVPARVVKSLGEEDLRRLRESPDHYLEQAALYLAAYRSCSPHTGASAGEGV